MQNHLCVRLAVNIFHNLEQFEALAEAINSLDGQYTGTRPASYASPLSVHTMGRYVGRRGRGFGAVLLCAGLKMAQEVLDFSGTA